MQPARKLLSLLFLILMGTELTQVRAPNAIFLPACKAPARPPGSPAKSGSGSAQPRSPCLGARAPGLGREPGPYLGWREGCRLTRDWGWPPRTPQP